MSRPAPCRAFEERLVRALDRAEARWPVDAIPREDEHLAECAACRSLAAVLAEDLLLLSRLAPVEPPAGLLDRLRAAFGRQRRAAAPEPSRGAEAEGPGGAEEVLGLLTPGVLARPELPERLRERLSRIPAERPRGKVVSIEAGRKGRSRGPLAALSDWRVAVALAYAATLLIALVLRLDPLSTAKTAAVDLTTAGEQAITAARSSAERRIADVRSRGSIRDQLGYRLYRAVAVGKARATAYTGLVLERVFGSEEPATADGTRKPSGRENGRSGEPEGRSFRS